jgi:microsomal dipeptidase-like Zn-dependent dipeptidase
MIIDGLQYNNWDRVLFEQARAAGLTAIHVTVAYWENASETRANISQWREWFETHSDLIMPVTTANAIREADSSGRTGIILGFQNCSPIEDDFRMVNTMYDLGARIMQLSYNNQSLLATGCYERADGGVTRFGREVIREMNRLGMVIDMSHSAERSTLEAMEISARPIVISHANPSFFHSALRNKSDRVLKALSETGGLLGCSLYPFHLPGGASCSRQQFCEMLCRLADLIGTEHVGIGSDLCLGWGYDKLEWMRNGRWANIIDHGEDDSATPAWPEQPAWFGHLKDFGEIEQGLEQCGMDRHEIDGIMGGNWFRFLEQAWEPQPLPPS